MGHGGQRKGAGRKASTITSVAARLPDGLGKELLFEIQIALLRLQRAGPPRQQEMVADVIAALRRVPENQG